MRARLLRRSIVTICLGLAGLQVAQAVEPLYVNSGSVTNELVNATSFLNEGYFQTSTSLPYETQNTLNFTNRGIIEGSIGYRFHSFTNSFRRRAVSFDNASSIEAIESTIIFVNSPVLINNQFSSYLQIDSTNIVNSGAIAVGPSGLLRLDGNNVNLRGGALKAADSTTFSGIFFTSLDSIFRTNFFSEAKVSDLYWGVGTNNVLSGTGQTLDLTSGQLDPTSFNFGSGFHEVIDSSGFTNTTRVPWFNSFSSGFRPYVNVTQVNSTNRVIQVVYVSTNIFDPDMAIDVRFASNGGNARGRQAIVQFSVADTDAITGSPSTNTLYFSDNSHYALFATNLFYQDSFTTATFRPNPYDVETDMPFEWSNAQLPNGVFNAAMFSQGYANSEVPFAYAGYSAYIGNTLDTNIVNSALLLEPTNSAGRIEVAADFLDMNGARMRSEGLLLITAKNFAAVTNGARLDAQEMSLNWTSTNQTLVISNILAGNVKRIGGSLNAYSAVWTNQTLTGEEDRFHVLILENLLTASQASKSYSFVMRVTNQPNSSIVIYDDVNVARNFYLDAENITINGNLTLPNSIGYTNMPRVLNFTNNGSISIPSLTAFTRQTGPYNSFVNSNSIVAGAQAVNTDYFQNSGFMQATVGSIGITNSAGAANLTNGTLMSVTDLRIATDWLQSSNSYAYAGSVSTNFFGQVTFSIGSINLTVGSGFVDGGSNQWTAFNGVNLYKAVPGGWQGDLLGTRFVSYARPFSLTRHTWTAADHGADRSGFTNNAAVGILTLDGFNSGRFRFSSPDAGPSAIYVDYLDLQNNATNYATALEIDSNFTVYFAAANLPASKLDGSHSGRLRWVQNFAGPNSSTNIVLADGRTITVNRALVESDEIDSDGDGLVNRYDSSPFDGPALSTAIVDVPPLSTILSWNGAANTTYTVDYTTNLVSWQVLTTVTTGASAGPVSIQDPVSPDGPRFYRVRYSP